MMCQLTRGPGASPCGKLCMVHAHACTCLLIPAVHVGGRGLWLYQSQGQHFGVLVALMIFTSEALNPFLCLHLKPFHKMVMSP